MATVLTVFSLAGGVAAAVEGEDWREQIDSWEDQGAVLTSRAIRIPKNMAATGVSEITYPFTMYRQFSLSIRHSTSACPLYGCSTVHYTDVVAATGVSNNTYPFTMYSVIETLETYIQH